MMKDVAKIFKALGDETRLRMLHVLDNEEVAAKDLEEILNLGQSRVSSQLAVIRESLVMKERREGRTVFLALDDADTETASVMELLRPRFAASRLCRLDLENLQRLAERRRADGSGYSDPAEGDLGRRYLPGRTWEGFARALLTLIPRQRVADIGVGDGDMTRLLARFSERLYAIDPSEAVLARLARKAEGREGIETRQGEIERIPLDDGSVDLVVASQVLHLAADPAAAIVECARVLATGGRLLILDLKSHDENWVREKLGHRHLGFSEAELREWLAAAGLEDATVAAVARDGKAPHFVSIMATARRAEA